MCRGRKIQWDLFSKAASLVYSFRCVADVILWDGSSGLVPDPAGPSVGISAGFGTGSAWVLIRTSPRQAGRPLFAGAGDGEIVEHMLLGPDRRSHWLRRSGFFRSLFGLGVVSRSGAFRVAAELRLQLGLFQLQLLRTLQQHVHVNCRSNLACRGPEIAQIRLGVLAVLVGEMPCLQPGLTVHKGTTRPQTQLCM